MSQETVLVVVGDNRGRNGVFHTDRDCPSVRLSANLKEKPRSAFPEDLRECQRCAGDSGTPEGDPDWSFQKSLREAATADEEVGADV